MTAKIMTEERVKEIEASLKTPLYPKNQDVIDLLADRRALLAPVEGEELRALEGIATTLYKEENNRAYAEGVGRCVHLIRRLSAQLSAKDAALKEARTDLKEWKQQHENLLSVRDTDIRNLTAINHQLRDKLMGLTNE